MIDFEGTILNRPNATRNMSDDEFMAALPEMAEQLSHVDYHFHYTEAELQRDWQNLLLFHTDNHYTASQQRAGMKLCEQFFPNFYDIKNANGEEFKDFWTPECLMKILKWNRSSHSTPYLSELKRGVYFCYGLTKNTMYRPHLAKMICDYYHPRLVLDPCAGWGGRMLGAIASGAEYIAFEPNTETYKHLLELAKFLQIDNRVHIYNEGAENINSDDFKVNLILTSPPYFDLEIYCDEPTQSITGYDNYDAWLNNWLNPVVNKCLNSLVGGASCWNVAPNMIADVEKIHQNAGFSYDTDFGLHSSARQANQNIAKNAKTTDATICYKIR